MILLSRNSSSCPCTTLLRNVDQQVGHLGLARQLAQHLPQQFLHFFELLLQLRQVHHLALLEAELVEQFLLLGLVSGQRLALGLHVQPPAGADDDDEDQCREHRLDRRGPGAHPLEVEVVQVEFAEFHGAAPPVAAVAAAGSPSWPSSPSTVGFLRLTRRVNM